VESKYLGCAVGEVNNPGIELRTTVVDANHDGAMITQIRYSNQSAERQTTMGTGHLVHIEGLAAGSGLALEWRSIPGSLTQLGPFSVMRSRQCWDPKSTALEGGMIGCGGVMKGASRQQDTAGED